MMQSGIAPLDQHLGGLMPGRLHLLTGGPGSGKSTACLQVMQAALATGDSVALLTLAEPADLAAHARSVGLDLESALRAGRMILLRYRSTFPALLARAALPQHATADLQRIVASFRPARFVIDPLTPFLADPSASGAVLSALAQLIDGLGVTTLVTYPGDVSAGYDARLDPLVQRAAAIVHFSRSSTGAQHVQVVQSRTRAVPRAPVEPEPVARPRLVTPPEENRLPDDAPALNGRRLQLLALHTAARPSDELAALLGQHFDVTWEPATTGSLSERHEPAQAVLIETDPDALGLTTTLVRDAATRPGGCPVVVVSARRLRSVDCARLLRAGAQDSLTLRMSPPELDTRITRALLQPARSGAAPVEPDDAVRAPSANGAALQPLDRDGLAGALAAQLASDPRALFTLISFSCRRGSAETLDALARLALGSMRIAGGDLAAVSDERVFVLLQGARQPDADAFVERLQSQWARKHRTALRIESLVHPIDQARLPTFLQVVQPT